MRAILLLFWLLSMAAPAAAEWRVAESAHFRVYANMNAEALRGRVELLEDYRNLLEMFTTAKVDELAPKLDIYLVDRIEKAVPFGTVPPTVAGFYNAGDSGIAAYAVKGDFGQKVLLHEYAHHHMFASTGQSYPTWYAEGFAEYFMTATFAPNRVEFGLLDPGRVYSLQQPWLAWDKLIESATGELRSQERYMFYAQSWLLTHYMFRVPEMREKLTAHLKAIAGGSGSLAAFKAHILPEPRQLNSILKNYSSGRSFTYSRLARTAPAPVAVKVQDLPESADAMMMYYAAFDNRGSAVTDRSKALAAVQAAAKRYDGDAFAARTLAMAELYLGDPARAVTVLRPLLAKSPADPELMRLQASALLAIDAAANRREARRLLVQAVKAAPNDWRAMHVYVHTHNIETGTVDDNLFAVVQLMWSLAPQVPGIVLDMASVLAGRGRLAEAAKVLEPVAFDPHGSRYASFARLLRDAALAGDAKAYQQLLTEGPPKTPPPETVIPAP
ncbi:tetratricopeptide repeat protein [Sandarakinorhabdus sp.]|uniref:tetratricopeptide repeat protein n=1 Tax=Sandarakinorhabdus sp. TaxID=1916663 RepID=UPI00333E58BA